MKALLFFLLLSLSWIVSGCGDTDGSSEELVGLAYFPAEDTRVSMTFDREGKVYVGSMSKSGSALVPVVRRFSSGGVLEASIPVPVKEDFTVTKLKIAVGGTESDPRIFVAGAMVSLNRDQPVSELFVLAMNSSGKVVFEDSLGGPKALEDAISDFELEADRDGNFYWAGGSVEYRGGIKTGLFTLQRYDAKFAGPFAKHETSWQTACRPQLRALTLVEKDEHPTVYLAFQWAVYGVAAPKECTPFPGSDAPETQKGDDGLAVAEFGFNGFELTKTWTRVGAGAPINVSPIVGGFAFEYPGVGGSQQSYLAYLVHDNGISLGGVRRPTSSFVIVERGGSELRLSGNLVDLSEKVSGGSGAPGNLYFTPTSVSDGLVTGSYRDGGGGLGPDNLHRAFSLGFSFDRFDHKVRQPLVRTDYVRTSLFRSDSRVGGAEVLLHKFNRAVGAYFAVGVVDSDLDKFFFVGRLSETGGFVTK